MAKELIPEEVVGVVDPAPRPRRRTFTEEYRECVLAEYEAAPYGEKGAVLRREGLYQTMAAERARARDAREAGGVFSRPVGRRGSRSHTGVEAVKVAAENARLRKQLEQAQAALDVMGKAHRLLELLSESQSPVSPEAIR